MNEGEMRELVTRRWFPALERIKLLFLFAKIRVDFDDLHGKMFRWERAIF